MPYVAARGAAGALPRWHRYSASLLPGQGGVKCCHERVVAENIIPIGAGPEDYQPTPADAQKIAVAAIVFYNGHGLEEWLDGLFKSVAKPGQPQIAVSDGLVAQVITPATLARTYGAQVVLPDGTSVVPV